MKLRPKPIGFQALPKELHVKDSPIAGQGLFAKEDIAAMMYLGISHVVVDKEIIRTPLGGFVNHSDEPNCIKWCENNVYYMKINTHSQKLVFDC